MGVGGRAPWVLEDGLCRGGSCRPSCACKGVVLVVVLGLPLKTKSVLVVLLLEVLLMVI